ncbi:MAG: S46 family peptidase [Saprospiraceae bacterium]|nr:S46 family peptidase [Saprospiraceae bacterium]MBK8827934.1 S46 family peptidase [Saprospiraceae bacterium]MBK8886096.1 S46 family peptidase [Saprospiraceae bacterium]MBP6539180.1 S46 family peptidase [Saprospiraceae bacterium]MBP8212395.1 S46 family peptidase [Saprospiraceae bacterium]
MNHRFLISTIFVFGFIFIVSAQKKASPYDFGKMWTFENPPKEWLKTTYGMDVQDEWFDYVRKSSLRFATWCSASFISENGLIMTNHHCSRDVVTALQKEGENFDKQGFYAVTQADERKAEGLFVEQMIKAEDITKLVAEKTKNAKNDAEVTTMRKAALEEIEKMYKEKEDWKDLRTQVVTFYSGGKFSIYGYKRFSDIRLVWIPELDLGFFGGDPDNFTYPRYNLDVTFWRAYDEQGNPLNTGKNYLKFNKKGAAEGEPVFVVGNPGRTERYRTVSQLTYDRDYRYPLQYKFLKNRNDMLMRKYHTIKSDPTKEYEAQELLNDVANVANSMKAFGGISKGLKDPALFGRKVEMENFIRSKAPGVTYWDEMAKQYETLNPQGWAITYLSPSPYRGVHFTVMHDLMNYKEMVKNNGPQDKKDKLKSTIIEKFTKLNDPEQIEYFTLFLNEVKEDAYPGDMTLQKVLGKRSINEYVKYLVKETKFTEEQKVTKLFEKEDKMEKDDDPLMEAAAIFVSRYKEATQLFQNSGPARQSLEAKIANQAFKVYGDQLPPDATFTLRISDGVIKGYDYNGTKAPVVTTFFGLYDRYYSFNKEFPWTLPERWQNPSMELLMSPFNTVSTNDIIGGNSGSPLINKNREAVGLIFDGNIESLPGNFIFDEEVNRTVSVHAGGIYAALKYIYKADRIVAEID